MQLKSSLISFNHHFDSPVIPTKRKSKLLIIGSLDFFFILSKSSSFTCAHFANHFVIYLEVDSQPRQCSFSCFPFSDIIDLSIYISVQAQLFYHALLPYLLFFICYPSLCCASYTASGSSRCSWRRPCSMPSRGQHPFR